MSLWPEYHPNLFVDRPRAMERIRRWANDHSARRVLVLVAPPGSGKSWLMRKMEEEWKSNRLTVWLNAPQLIDRQETQNPNQVLKRDAFDGWFEEIQQRASQFCTGLRPIGRFAALDAQIEALVNMVCRCALRYDPILIVDAYDEITELQALTLSLRVLAKFISRPCIRLLIAVRSESLIQEDTLRRHEERFPLTDETLNEGFARQQFEKRFAQEHPGQPLPSNLDAWMAGYRHYSWRNPAINYFLFSKALTNSISSLSHLTDSDLKECIQELIRRDGRYPPLNEEEFKVVYEIATKLGEEWSYLETEELLSTHFYTDPKIGRLLEMGVILWQAGLFYRIETSIRELLLEIRARPHANQENVV